MDNDTDIDFLDQIKEFNAELEAKMDAINTAGDREALLGIFEQELAKHTLGFARRVRDIALFSDSDQSSISALKLACGYLFDAKNKNEDAFDRLMGELIKNDK